MIITFLSDTHTFHRHIEDKLPGGDILIHSGDFTNIGERHDIERFCKWFDAIDNYDCKIFIAGNHDRGFEDSPEKSMQIVNSYKNIDYLQDDLLLWGEEYDSMIKIWGSPWQPEFYSWAFNLPRNGAELEYKWSQIPVDTDILITHGPPFGVLDQVKNRPEHLGCELLAKRVDVIKPKIHCFGHIHSARGVYSNGETLFINASILDEKYRVVYDPITIDYDFEYNTYKTI